MAMATSGEINASFPCFGGRAAVLVMGDGAERAVHVTRVRLEDWHRRLTRFEPTSELSVLNAAGTSRVRVSSMLYRFAAVALGAAWRTNGLVDPTLVDEVESAGYSGDLGAPVPLADSLRLTPRRTAARPRGDARWRRVKLDPRTRTITRPPGVRLDSGGIAKGLFADLAGTALAGSASYAVDCCGDLAIGGRERLERQVRVDDPFGRGVLHEFHMRAGGVATSGIGRRSWMGDDGRPSH